MTTTESASKTVSIENEEEHSETEPVTKRKEEEEVENFAPEAAVPDLQEVKEIQTYEDAVLVDGEEEDDDEESDFSESALESEESFEEEYEKETEEEQEESAWASDEREYPYEVPRPALTLDEASYVLGKSIRAIERSIQGKWGNRLPEGWQARKMKIDGESEWRIIPPAGFRIRHTVSNTVGTKSNISEPEAVESSQYDSRIDEATDCEPLEENGTTESSTAVATTGDKSGGLKLPGFNFSLEGFLNSASNKAKTELVRASNGVNDLDMDHPTIVIDRSDDVERLLRELANTQKELAEERRQRMDDLRTLSQMQSSMRLLEDHASQTSILKEELVETREALKLHKEQYQAYLKLPWWKKIFKKAP